VQRRQQNTNSTTTAAPSTCIISQLRKTPLSYELADMFVMSVGNMETLEISHCTTAAAAAVANGNSRQASCYCPEAYYVVLSLFSSLFNQQKPDDNTLACMFHCLSHSLPELHIALCDAAAVQFWAGMPAESQGQHGHGPIACKQHLQ
jgi:hypothetical protein